MEIESSLTTHVNGGFSPSPSPSCHDPNNPNHNKLESSKANPKTKNNNDDDEIDSTCDASNLPEIKFRLGDRVMLHMKIAGRSHLYTGIVRFIGKTNFIQGDIVGLELDSWNPNASNGTINGEKIIDTQDGRAWFLQRCSLIDFVPSFIHDGTYARLKGLEKVPHFNGKAVKVISYVPRKARWKVKIIQLTKTKEKNYLGMREDNLDPMLDWEPKPLNDIDYNIHVTYKIDDINIGDAVKMTNKKWGIVKYIGETKWIKNVNANANANAIETMIGLELIEWSPNAKNGTVEDIEYFTVNDGFGYFTILDNIVDIMKNYILWKQERIIWIGFDKNIKNFKCLLVKLPKDIIKYILTLVGNRIK